MFCNEYFIFGIVLSPDIENVNDIQMMLRNTHNIENDGLNSCLCRCNQKCLKNLTCYASIMTSVYRGLNSTKKSVLILLRCFQLC